MKFRLSTRLILSVVLIELVMLTVLVWNSVRLISSSHAEVLEHQINEEAGLLAGLLAPGLAVSDRAILLDALSLIGKNKNIVYADVQNSSGSSMASIGKLALAGKLNDSFEESKQNNVFNVETDISLSGQKLGNLRIGYSTDYVEHLVKKTRVQNTSIASIEIILSIIVTLIVGFFLTRGLRKLEEGAKALTRDELEHRIDLDSNDEMGDLARSFNELAGHLSETRAALALENKAMEQQTQHLQTLMDGVGAVIVEMNPADWQFKYVSREAENLLGYPLEDWYKLSFLEKHMCAEDQEVYFLQREVHKQKPGSVMLDFRMTHIEGHLVDLRSINTFDFDSNGQMTCRSLLLDITEQKLNELRIAFLAEHDVLTGLFNRARFQEELERAVDIAERFEQEGSLMFIDLDQFKYINDTMGHQAGDEYLCAIAHRLAGSLRKIDILGRLGGDEFGVILPNTNQQQAEKVAEHLMQGLIAKKNEVVGADTPVTASLGIVTFPQHGTVPGNLLALADAAMYTAKDKGRNTYHVYSEQDTQLESMYAKLQWEERIRHALENDLFVLHYQPIFRLDDRTISHYEVLLRMVDGGGELIFPGAFLEIAERFGMIRDIDQWVLRHAIKAQADSCATDNPLSLAINLSGKHFGNPHILEWIKEYIEQTGADSNKLIFEITETAAVENISQASRFTHSLHAIGCRIALDDFGVGFSSFNYLKKLPVDIIKLDGSYVRNLASDKFDRVFIESMSAMARGLGISCVAEFIENEEVITLLKQLQVDMGQGYHLGKPAEQKQYIPEASSF